MPWCVPPPPRGGWWGTPGGWGGVRGGWGAPLVGCGVSGWLGGVCGSVPGVGGVPGGVGYPSEVWGHGCRDGGWCPLVAAGSVPAGGVGCASCRWCCCRCCDARVCSALRFPLAVVVRVALVVSPYSQSAGVSVGVGAWRAAPHLLRPGASGPVWVRCVPWLVSLPFLVGVGPCLGWGFIVSLPLVVEGVCCPHCRDRTGLSRLWAVRFTSELSAAPR